MSDREKYDRGREKLGRIWLIPGKKIPAHVRPQKVRPHLRDREKGVYRDASSTIQGEASAALSVDPTPGKHTFSFFCYDSGYAVYAILSGE